MATFKTIEGVKVLEDSLVEASKGLARFERGLEVAGVAGDHDAWDNLGWLRSTREGLMDVASEAESMEAELLHLRKYANKARKALKDAEDVFRFFHKVEGLSQADYDKVRAAVADGVGKLEEGLE